MDGFKRPLRPNVPADQSLSQQNQASPSASAVPPSQSESLPTIEQNLPTAIDLADQSNSLTEKPPTAKRWFVKKRFWIPFALLVVLLVGGLVAINWYNQSLKPVGGDITPQKVVITPEASFSFVTKRLKERGVIRSELAANIYGYLSGKQNQLKEGTCILTGESSTQEIIDKLSQGCHDFKSIMFYPGATIEKPLYKPVHAEMSDTMYIKHVLESAGYSQAEIAAALSKQYDSPLFAGKPADASLEGYIYGQTYFVEKGASAEQVLQVTFAQMNNDINQNDLVKKFQAQGLNLFEGITLASIVQRELNCEGKPTKERTDRCYRYQQTIAQIFLKRLKEGISLGSDVTFIYAADQKGVTPTVNIDSPYNTRVHTGLPPGPIASPGIHALMSVGNPSDTDYLFFIAGDDGLIYFAKDVAGHEANIKNHCQQLCNEL